MHIKQEIIEDIRKYKLCTNKFYYLSNKDYTSNKSPNKRILSKFIRMEFSNNRCYKI